MILAKKSNPELFVVDRKGDNIIFGPKSEAKKFGRQSLSFFLGRITDKSDLLVIEELSIQQWAIKYEVPL